MAVCSRRGYSLHRTRTARFSTRGRAVNIDWTAFTPWSALAGGAIIGVAATLFALFNGRVAGISGIVGGLLRPSLTGRGLARRVPRRADRRADRLPLVRATAADRASMRITRCSSSPASWSASGRATASGCTSGHGVCGLSRLSPRSLVATLAFMAAGFATVFATRHSSRPERRPMYAFFALSQASFSGSGSRVGNGQSGEGARISRSGRTLGSVARLRDGRRDRGRRHRIRDRGPTGDDAARNADAAADDAHDRQASRRRRRCCSASAGDSPASVPAPRSSRSVPVS